MCNYLALCRVPQQLWRSVRAPHGYLLGRLAQFPLGKKNAQETHNTDAQKAAQGQAFEHAHVTSPCHVDPLNTSKGVHFPHTSTVIARVAEIIASFPGVISRSPARRMAEILTYCWPSNGSVACTDEYICKVQPREVAPCNVARRYVAPGYIPAGRLCLRCVSACFSCHGIREGGNMSVAP